MHRRCAGVLGPQIVTAGVTNGYTVDNASRITGLSDSGLSSNTWTFGYDLLDRVSSGSSSALSRGYTYDANSNRLTETGTLAYTASITSTNNQLASTTGGLARTYAYDNAGNTTSYTGNSYTFNQRGRMSSAGGGTTNYVYDALGQLIEKSGNGGTTLLMYDEAGHILGEYSSAGALIEETIWMGDLPVATLQPNGSSVSIYYLHTDHLGTPRKVTRTSDNGLMWRWDPDTFGSVTPNTNPAGLGTFNYNLRFPGQYYLAETGLMYNYFRDLDPQTGRYIESDPIGWRGGTNPYRYVSNDPLLFSDPLGLCNSSLKSKARSAKRIRCNYDFRHLLRIGNIACGYSVSLKRVSAHFILVCDQRFVINTAGPTAKGFRMDLDSNAALTSGNSAVALIDEGNALEEQGRLAEAMKCYEAAVQADPRCARAHLNRGNILFADARIDEARNAYQVAIACDPRYAAAYFNLANLNCRVGEYEQALREYEIAIGIKPDFADAFVALGNALADLGRNAEAVENYQRAVASGGEGAGVPSAFVTRLFDDYAPRFDHHLLGKLAYSVPTAMRQAAGRIFKDRRFHRALDLGCGTGLIGEHFRDVVSEIDGVDLSGNMLEQARRKEIYSRLDCDEIVAWLERAATDSLRYDLVVAADVFVYVGNLEPAFSAVRRILSDGGLFVFSVEHLPQGSLELLPSFRYAHSTSYVRGLASTHGFTIELSEHVDSRKEGNATVRGTIFVLARN